MHSIKILNSLLCLAMAAISISTFSFTANADLKVEVVGQPIASGQDGEKTISFSYKITNVSAASVSSMVKFKPFLIPSDQPALGIPTQTAVVLKTDTIQVNLDGGANSVFVYNMDLPKVPQRTYLLGGMMTLRANDPNRNNDATENLVMVGPLSHSVPGPETRSADLYNYTQPIEARYGGAAHRWALANRGSLPTNGLMSVFFFVDIANRKLFFGSYEKTVGWINMGSAYDDQGRLVPYDIYTQSPSFERLPPGEYQHVALINSDDAVRGEDMSNNMDLRSVTLSHCLANPSSDIWFSDEAGANLTQSKSLNVQTSYQAAVNWTLTQDLPQWLSVGVTSGSLSGRTSRLALPITVDSAGLVAGVYTHTLRLNLAEFPNENCSYTVKLVVHKAAVPNLSARAPTEIVHVLPFASEITNVPLTNTSNEAIGWSVLTQPEWLLISGPRQGEIPAGNTGVIPVVAYSPLTSAAMTMSGVIRIQTTASSTPIDIPVSLRSLLPPTATE